MAHDNMQFSSERNHCICRIGYTCRRRLGAVIGDHRVGQADRLFTPASCRVPSSADAIRRSGVNSFAVAYHVFVQRRTRRRLKSEVGAYPDDISAASKRYAGKFVGIFIQEVNKKKSRNANENSVNNTFKTGKESLLGLGFQNYISAFLGFRTVSPDSLGLKTRSSA
jgi:hypothetical protein